ncbi:MAG: STAS domain-containing protein [Actinomycetota bacterium]
MDFRDPERGQGEPEGRITRHRMLGEIKGRESAELAPEGTLDIESADDFRGGFIRLLEAGIERFFVDLGGVDYIDSTGLGSLMQLYREARDRGGEVRFYNVTPAVRDIFSLTHLDKVITIDESREAAFAGAGGG